MRETLLLMVLADFGLCSPKFETEEPQVYLAKMAVDQRQGLVEDLLD